MLGLHVVLAVDRAGLVGEDGETHHGLFDVGFLRQAPGLKVLCPASCEELSDMLIWAVEEYDGPVAIRYPRGGNGAYTESAWQNHYANSGGLCCHRTGKDVTIITYGTLLQNAMDAAQCLHENNIEATVLRLMTVSPIAVDEILGSISENRHIVIMEESCSGGISDVVACQLYKRIPGCRVDSFHFETQFVTHGNVAQLYKQYHLDADSIADFIMGVRSGEG